MFDYLDQIPVLESGEFENFLYTAEGPGPFDTAESPGPDVDYRSDTAGVPENDVEDSSDTPKVPDENVDDSSDATLEKSDNDVDKSSDTAEASDKDVDDSDATESLKNSDMDVDDSSDATESIQRSDEDVDDSSDATESIQRSDIFVGNSSNDTSNGETAYKLPKIDSRPLASAMKDAIIGPGFHLPPPDSPQSSETPSETFSEFGLGVEVNRELMETHRELMEFRLEEGVQGVQFQRALVIRGRPRRRPPRDQPYADVFADASAQQLEAQQNYMDDLILEQMTRARRTGDFQHPW